MPAAISSASRIVYDAKGQRPARLSLWGADAKRGGTFFVDQGSSGGFHDRPTSDADTSITLPPGAPHLSLWRLDDGRLVRLCYREKREAWDFDEDRKVLEVTLWHWDEMRTKGSGRYRTAWPDVELTFPVPENASIVGTLGLGPPGRLSIRFGG